MNLFFKRLFSKVNSFDNLEIISFFMTIFSKRFINVIEQSRTNLQLLEGISLGPLDIFDKAEEFKIPSPFLRQCL